MKRALYLLTALLALTVPYVHAAEDEEPLPVEQAFQFTATAADAATVRTRWHVAKDYYLYKGKFHFTTATAGITLGEPRMPVPQVKQDPSFGRVEVYHGDFTIDIPVMRGSAAALAVELTAGYQGCAEVLGLCYPPQRTTVKVDLPAAVLPTPAPAKAPGAAPAKAPFATLLGKPSGGEAEPLDPDVAFQFSSEVEGDALVARWQIAPGYYLYRDKISFKLQDGSGVSLGDYTLPPGQEKNDETFGRLSVYHNAVEARIPLHRSGAGPAQATLQVGYQGCAELLGICYPPIKKQVALDLGGAGAAPAAAGPSAAAVPAPPASEQDSLAASLAGGNRLATILTFFGLGLLLAFTPCVFPMIPILSSIIVGQGAGLTTRRAFVLSLVYVLAMAATYTVAGVAAGLFGANLQAAFQNPWILGSFSAVFVLLAFSMFGFYELQLPSVLQSRISELSNKQQSGSLVGVAVMGLLSALIVGPCVAPPLMGALIYIGRTGDALLGGTALFALSLGMGAPLLLIGTSAGKLLPRAGGWMEAVKAVFGVMLLAVALWMLDRILPPLVTMLGWSLLAIVSAVYMGALEPIREGASGWRKLWKGLGVALLIYGALLLVGVGGGATDPTRPLHGPAFGPMVQGPAAPAGELQFRHIKTTADLDRELTAARAAGRTVMVDFYANWCVSCKEFAKYTFSDPGVRTALAGTVLLQADVTANDEADQALLKRFGLFGPPSILFFGTDGQERRAYRVIGFMEPNQFRAQAEGALRQ